ncbi:bifunctional phosphoribosyl-AMP cyclohydrolase/phosphoribosyl-ATP diphosphatase, partial [Vibrio parahaemolyticus]|nr:bifunctional phosphoribosyl-AMP cyclohydrolase/phosphoribosyl-ATP diphosphatase [Vibrio parahaemolyticus]
LVCESADLIYHLMVLLQDQGLSMNDVVNKLKERHK